ncbi:MAG: hypothetical protein L0215_22315 [Gemmataceae bacterium]|nr:hypothetical protein [Gemmataceae bacterium]
MKLVENSQIVAGFVPLDLQIQRDGDWVSMKDFNHLTVIFYKAGGTDGDDAIVTLQQAQDNAGTGVKALNFTEIWRKQATDVQTIGQFTKTTQAAANTYTNTDAHQQAIWVLEIDADMLDVDGGFDHVRLNLNDTGVNAQLGCVLYVLSEPRFAEATPPSAI